MIDLCKKEQSMSEKLAYIEDFITTQFMKGDKEDDYAHTFSKVEEKMIPVLINLSYFPLDLDSIILYSIKRGVGDDVFKNLEYQFRSFADNQKLKMEDFVKKNIISI